ncbi:MAG: hypothetical protein ACO3EE_04890 [Flavobacteriales bacterium]
MQEYFETQYIRKTIMGIFVIAIMFIVSAVVIVSLFVESTDIVSKIFVVLVLIASFIFFYVMKLEYKITEQKIEYKYFPFHRKWRSIDRSEVANISFVQYIALKEYGGWGIKYGRKGIAYNVSGNYGIFVELKSGKTMMLGTVKYKELCK